MASVWVVRWETDTYPGFHPDGPQGLIDPIIDISACDVLIGIFWKRFGTPVKDSPSGTAHEFRLAYEGWQEKRRPQVMVYFNEKPYSPKSKEETDQWGQVLEFKKEFPKKGLWWPYKGNSNFKDLLRTHLTNFIRAEFPLSPQTMHSSSPKASAPSMSQSTSPSETRSEYFQVQPSIIAEYDRAFVGREKVQQAFSQFLASNPRGYFILRGNRGSCTSGRIRIRTKQTLSGARP